MDPFDLLLGVTPDDEKGLMFKGVNRPVGSASGVLPFHEVRDLVDQVFDLGFKFGVGLGFILDDRRRALFGALLAGVLSLLVITLALGRLPAGAALIALAPVKGTCRVLARFLENATPNGV